MVLSELFLTGEQREMMKVGIEKRNLACKMASSEGLLTDEQCEMMKVGIEKMVRGSKILEYQKARKDGAGGIDTDGESHINRNDPNYERAEEPYELVGSMISYSLDKYKQSVVSLIIYKQSVVSLIEKYFSTGDVDLAAFDLIKLGSMEFVPYFVKRLVSMAMDRLDKQKEMASVLLSALNADVISSAQIIQGFLMLLESADALAVDILDSVDVLALFLARAVVDGILLPVFLPRANKSLSEFSMGIQVIQTAESYLSAPHSAEFVKGRWGGSTHSTVKEVNKKIADLLMDGDNSKACACIRELEVAFFHHEVVKMALVLGMKIPTAEPLILKLLKEAKEEKSISSTQIVKGFARFAESLDDFARHIPSAKFFFLSLVPKAKSEGWLDASFPKSSDEDQEVEYTKSIDILEYIQNMDLENLRQYANKVEPIILDYFQNGSIYLLVERLEDLRAPHCKKVFVKELIFFAIYRGELANKRAYVLLSALHLDWLSDSDIFRGFLMLFKSKEFRGFREITEFNVLVGRNLLHLLARVIVDGVLNPWDLEKLNSLLPRPGCKEMEKILKQVWDLITAPDVDGKRVPEYLFSGAMSTVRDAKDTIKNLLEQYENEGAVSEACRCIHDIGMPFFSHEVVRMALVMAMEKKSDRMFRVFDLLEGCINKGLIAQRQMVAGFKQIERGNDNFALDIPNAKEQFSFYVDHAEHKGWLPPTFKSDALSLARDWGWIDLDLL